MDFKNWLSDKEISEVSTGTGDVAAFARIAIGTTRRIWPPMITFQSCDDEAESKKKKKKEK